jgi:GNAT superfamily N-acetyltransferase
VFATSSLAQRIERAEVELVAASAAACAGRVPAAQLISQRIAGGIAVFVEPNCPFNKIAGLGFDGAPAEAELDALERAFSDRGASVQAEVSTLADPAVAKLLTGRGYRLVGFENILGLDLRTWTVAANLAEEIDVNPAGAAEDQLWLETVTTGFLHADTFDGPPSHESFGRESIERIMGDMLRAPGLERYIARRGGDVAGGASLRIEQQVALLCGAATLPPHRRRGVQSTLLQERLRAAANRGCDIAVVTTQPASKSQENVQRAGFSLLYSRAVLVLGRG